MRDLCPTSLAAPFLRVAIRHPARNRLPRDFIAG